MAEGATVQPEVERYVERSARHEGPEERPGQVEEQILVLTDHVERLGFLVVRLEDRMASVIQQHDDVASLVPAAVPSIVGLADRLRDRNFDLSRYNARLQLLLDNCEL